MRKTVGLFRPLRFDHLDLTAKLLVKYSIPDTFEILDDVLAKEFKGKEGRRKIINNLTRVWSGGKKEPSTFQKEVLAKYNVSDKNDKIIYQYLMTSLAFPFFSETTTFVGKYLKMSDTFKSSVILSEMRNSYGSAESVYKGVNAVLNGLKSWEILSEGNSKNDYVFKDNLLEISNEFQLNLLVLVVIQNHVGDSLTIEQINNHASMFPFRYLIRKEDIVSSQFEIIEDRLDTYISILS